MTQAKWPTGGGSAPLERTGSRSSRGRAVRRQIGLVLIVAGLTACSGSGADPDPSGVSWTLTELQGQPPLDGTTVDLSLDEEGNLSGSAGCNRYTGSADFGNGEMSVDANTASTMMACEEPIMAQEAAFFAVLLDVAGYEIADDELRLLDADGTVVARFA